MVKQTDTETHVQVLPAETVTMNKARMLKKRSEATNMEPLKMEESTRRRIG